ncbi:MAG: phosphoribosylanthranilate isomerase [Nitrososphaerota archaeon]
MVRVKICGITREEDLAAAAAHGADAIGLVVGFPRSPRNLSIERARALRRMAPPFLNVVLVVDGADRDMLIRAVREIRPDAVQVYSEVNPDILRDLGAGWVIKPVRVEPGIELDYDGFDAILLDSSMGRGLVPDWKLCREMRERSRLPVILAGGLNSQNVLDVIRIVKPYGVDVSSGVELSPGIKDAHMIREFIRRVREAELDEV